MSVLDSIPVIPDWIRIVHTENPGAAFGARSRGSQLGTPGPDLQRHFGDRYMLMGPEGPAAKLPADHSARENAG